MQYNQAVIDRIIELRAHSKLLAAQKQWENYRVVLQQILAAFQVTTDDITAISLPAMCHKLPNMKEIFLSTLYDLGAFYIGVGMRTEVAEFSRTVSYQFPDYQKVSHYFQLGTKFGDNWSKSEAAYFSLLTTEPASRDYEQAARWSLESVAQDPIDQINIFNSRHFVCVLRMLMSQNPHPAAMNVNWHFNFDRMDLAAKRAIASEAINELPEINRLTAQNFRALMRNTPNLPTAAVSRPLLIRGERDPVNTALHPPQAESGIGRRRL